jgi:hypothetical protein
MVARSPPTIGNHRCLRVLRSRLAKGVNHVSNPINYAALSDVPQGTEAYAPEGNGRA